MPEPIGFSKEKANQVLEKYDIDLLIATTPVNVFYTSGLPTTHVAPNPILYVLSNQFPNITLIRRDGEEHLEHWMLFQSTKKFTWITDLNGNMSPTAALEGMAETIKKWGLEDKTIGLESLMPRFEAEFLRERFPDAKFVNGDQAFLDMRIVKTEAEIELIKKSTEITEQAILKCIDSVQEGLTDNDFLQIARRSIVDAGADGWDHLTMAIGGSDPEAPGVGTVIKPGDLSRFDFGTVYKGYISDVSREVVIGEPPAAAQQAVELMTQVQEYAVDLIKPGVNTKEAGAQVKAYIKQVMGKANAYMTVHSLGLEVEEVHLFSPMKTQDMPFLENMVMDVEVWQTVKPFGMVGVEDCYRVTDSGMERLSSLDKNIFIR